MYQHLILRAYNSEFYRFTIIDSQNAMYVFFSKYFAIPTHSLIASRK